MYQLLQRHLPLAPITVCDGPSHWPVAVPADVPETAWVLDGEICFASDHVLARRVDRLTFIWLADYDRHAVATGWEGHMRTGYRKFLIQWDCDTATWTQHPASAETLPA